MKRRIPSTISLLKINLIKNKLGETAVFGMHLVFFCLILAMFCVNFDVCSICFVMYLLNSVSFSIFIMHLCVKLTKVALASINL